MEERRKELRDELFNLRLQLEQTKMERIDDDPRLSEIKDKIKDVKHQYAREIIEEREESVDGKKI